MKILDSCKLAAVGDNDGGLGLVVSVDRVALDGVKHLQAICDLAEDDVGAVQVGCVHEAEEELAAVGAWARVSHGQDAATCVLVREVLIIEVRSIDGLTTGAISSGKVTTLGHEVWDNAMEGAALVVQCLAARGLSLLTGAEGAEILRSQWRVVVQVNGDAPGRLTTDRDVEEDFAVDSWSCHRDCFWLGWVGFTW